MKCLIKWKEILMLPTFCLHLSILFLNLIILFTGEHSFADEYHIKDILIGERAAGMGGAFISISDDPSGIFYNPAGILFSFENYFSLSANAYSVSNQVYKNVIGGKDYAYTSSGLVPNFFGLIQNVRKSKFGFAIIVPKSDLFDQDDDIEINSTSAGSPVNFKRKFFRSNSTLLIGPAFATELFKDFSIGFSVFAAYHVDKAIDNQSVFFKADAGGKERFFIQNVTISQTDVSILPKIGFQFMPFNKVAVGLTASKSFQSSSTRTVKNLSIATDAANNGLPVDFNYNLSHDLVKGSVTTQPTTYNPLEAGFGISYFPSKKWLFSTDITYASKDITFLDFPTQDTYNYAFGLEYYTSETFAIRLGAFTNNAITPKLVDSLANQSPHVDLMGMGLCFSSVNSGSSFTFGGNYSSGSGFGQPIGDQKTLTELYQNNMIVFLTGSYQL